MPLCAPRSVMLALLPSQTHSVLWGGLQGLLCGHVAVTRGLEVSGASFGIACLGRTPTVFALRMGAAHRCLSLCLIVSVCSCKTHSLLLPGWLRACHSNVWCSSSYSSVLSHSIAWGSRAAAVSGPRLHVWRDVSQVLQQLERYAVS